MAVTDSDTGVEDLYTLMLGDDTRYELWLLRCEGMVMVVVVTVAGRNSGNGGDWGVEWVPGQQWWRWPLAWV